MPYTVVCNCQYSLNGMLKLNSYVSLSLDYASGRGRGVGRGEGKRGQEKEDNHKTQTELVDAIHIKVFKGGVK